MVSAIAEQPTETSGVRVRKDRSVLLDAQSWRHSSHQIRQSVCLKKVIGAPMAIPRPFLDAPPAASL